MSDDIVERLRHYPMSRTGRLEDEAADEIERLREEVGYAKLMYDKHMAERLSRAEAEIERLRGELEYARVCSAAIADRDGWVKRAESAEAVIEAAQEDLRIAQGHTDAAIDDYNRCLPVIRRLREQAEAWKTIIVQKDEDIEWLRGDLDRAIRYKDNNISIADVALDRAERAEDEVERLREKLSQAERYAYLANSVIEAARHHVQYCHNTESAIELAEALRQIKKDPAEAGP